MSKPGYIIVKGELHHLPGYVNDAIQNGYRPIGAPFRMNSGNEYGAVIWWGQAMVLEGCKP